MSGYYFEIIGPIAPKSMFIPILLKNVKVFKGFKWLIITNYNNQLLSLI